MNLFTALVALSYFFMDISFEEIKNNKKGIQYTQYITLQKSTDYQGILINYVVPNMSEKLSFTSNDDTGIILISSINNFVFSKYKHQFPTGFV